jgi:type VI secretion system Hcp family effector
MKPGLPINPIVVALVVASLVLAAPVRADEIFVDMRSGNIEGESTDPQHDKWISAFALSNKVEVDCDFASHPSGNCTNPSFGFVSFLKGTDKATPLLHSKAALTDVIPEVVIEICRDGGAHLECYYKVTLTTVGVRDVSLAGAACTDPAVCNGGQSESVSLEFGRIEWEYTTFDQDSNPTGSTTQCWNVQTNGPC